ncbi:MAG: polysaccharide deacetylase [Candidatus Magnetoglobus multicellularis str. Araruama]|uniref:Polysaccharide deacetylase n=1 Tax=Candidatus Magnetoglobus multicellularis str. Araruama TaxID=890399 RepID=A0A1V1PH44_9BACT|nr:MAG: polysaccharide deacetylase [Candidatus Magnetoglobus multicellularis str. Araruama]
MDGPGIIQKKWYLNPFLFFEDALGIKNMPRPDPTTLNGLRVAFSHIDGDAFGGPSRINPKKSCAEIVRDEVLKKYQYPVTVSVIVAEIAPEAVGNKERVDLAKNIFALPNVEPASHAYSHPYYWNEHSTVKDRYPSQYGIPVPGYTFDAEKEIVYSMNYISKHLAPKDKPCRVMLWSGACDPTERDLTLCKSHQIYNMNGGDTVFDDANNSYTAVAPIYRKVGRTYQIHCGQANENILTNLWEGPYYGFREIIKTMKKTGHPKRIKPIDIYYHFYSGEYQSSLKALQNVYEWVLEQDILLVYTSEYIQMVQGFLDAAISKNNEGHYIITHYNHCLTMRFDHYDTYPDMRKCDNVLGYINTPQGLYVSLKPNTQKAVIAFPAENEKTQQVPYIEQASGWIMHFSVKGRHIQLDYKGFGKGSIRMAGLQPNTAYTVNQKYHFKSDAKRTR